MNELETRQILHSVGDLDTKLHQIFDARTLQSTDDQTSHPTKRQRTGVVDICKRREHCHRTNDSFDLISRTVISSKFNCFRTHLESRCLLKQTYILEPSPEHLSSVKYIVGWVTQTASSL